MLERIIMKKEKNFILKAAKKFTAGVLSAAMLFTNAPYLGGIEAGATVLLDNAELDPGSETGAGSGITRKNETAGGIYSTGDYTTYGQSQGTVYRYGRGGVSSNYQDSWGGTFYSIPNAVTPRTTTHSIAVDQLNMHGQVIYNGGNSHQYTFDIGATPSGNSRLGSAGSFPVRGLHALHLQSGKGDPIRQCRKHLPASSSYPGWTMRS